MVSFIFTVCHAQASIKGSPNSIHHSSIYDSLFSSKGPSFPDSKLGVAYINISLTERFSNLANMSFSIFMASRVYVHFLDNESSMIRLVHVSIDK